MSLTFRDIIFRIWYRYISIVDKNAEVLFMNFGYNDNSEKIDLEEQDLPNRVSIQLYHHLASAIEIKGKDIVEVGCGRGGGLNYITKSFSPKTSLGVDLDKKAIAFCNRQYKQPGLSFIQSNAQNLKLEDNSCDVVINVESSHRYPDMNAFLNEVKRILRPNGYFLFTDFRFDTQIEDFYKNMSQSGFKVISHRNINKEVVDALTLDDSRRRFLVKKLMPKILQNSALNFAGVVGSETYKKFETEKFVYFSYILQKD